jgi:hypothetical protein
MTSPLTGLAHDSYVMSMRARAAGLQLELESPRIIRGAGEDVGLRAATVGVAQVHWPISLTVKRILYGDVDVTVTDMRRKKNNSFDE